MEYMLGAMEYLIVGSALLLIVPCVIALVLEPLLQSREPQSARTTGGPGAESGVRP